VIFSIFRKAKPPPPPLTEICLKLANLENLERFVDERTRRSDTSIDNRAVALSAIIWAAAGNFVDGLRNSKDKVWKEVWHYLRDTDLDVLTAETIVWIAFLMTQLCRAEQKSDPEMFERIGGYGTNVMAKNLALGMIERCTGFDFEAKGKERGNFYFEELEGRQSGALSNAFASVVLRSAGRRSLAEPLKTIGVLQEPPEWIPLAAQVMIFYSTMPSGFYETYKNMLRAWPDRFPEYDNDLDD
jgi:hypothetical protein